MDTKPRLNETIRKLEKRLLSEPGDKQAARNLVTILDFHLPSRHGLGAYSDCQRTLATKYQEDIWINDPSNSDKAAEHYKQWQAILDSQGVNPKIAVGQLFVGELLTIHGELANCNLHLSLFEKKDVISRICHDCFKVQILPIDIAALIQVYFVLRNLKMPRGNCRKCMIEVRENIKYPYKGYIYCESEEETEYFFKIFQQKLKKFQISNVYCGISHGCSEYGVKYPKFKYSNDGTHRSFERPASWDQSESEFYSMNQAPRQPRKDYNHENITIRDVIALRTWIDYAEIIGDDSWRMFRDAPAANKPEPFATRVKMQSQMRKTQMDELRERLSSKAQL